MESVILSGVVPVLLAIGVLTALIAAGRVSPGARVSAYAGYWAGLLSFCGYALIVLQQGRTGGLDDWVPWPWTGLVGGFFVGLIGLGLYWALRNRRWVGVPCFVQSFGASASLLNYYGVPELRSFTAWLAIGVAVGSCAGFLVPRRAINRFQRWEIDRAVFLRWVYGELGRGRGARSERRIERWKRTFGWRQNVYRRFAPKTSPVPSTSSDKSANEQ